MAGPGTTRILTPDQRPRVFVSSTLEELAPERAAARAAIEDLRLIPVMFELGARPHPPRALYRAYLAQSHVFVGLYHQRYGWVAPDEEVSGLEDEYRLSAALPRLVYLKAPAPGREPRLAELVERIRADDTVAYRTFTTTDELVELLRDDLAAVLAERFLVPSPADEAAAPASLRPTWPVPRPLSSLVGRDAEVADAVDRFDSGARLVTLAGPGGIGKTRVALEAANRIAARGTVPVAFVPLESVAAAADVLPAVAASIGLGLDGGLPALDALAAAFADRPFLLVLDNLEQLLASAADLGELLARCPGVAVLATSRAPMRIRGEQLVPIGPLELPADRGDQPVEQSPAVRLFVERARAVRPAFALDSPEDRDAVAELCRRLDGIPLALELAAARSALLSPRALLERIGTALDLGAGTTDLPERQRTVRATLEWSEQLLSVSQRGLLARLSVFAAPWTLADADAVAVPDTGDALDDVAGLLENNLVAPAADGTGEPRFRLYESVRAYAGERLDPDTRDHVETAYVARLTRQAGVLSVGVRSPGYARWMPEFRLVWPDVRRAWELALDRKDADRVAVASMAVLPLWLEGRVRDAEELWQASLVLADERRPYRLGDVVFVVALSTYALGDYDRAAALFDRFDTDVPAPVDPDIVAGVPLMRAFVAAVAGDVDTCEREVRRCIELTESGDHTSGTDWLGAFAHNGLGNVLVLRGDVDGALREFALTRDRAVSSGNVGAQMQGLVFDADLRLSLGQVADARELLLAACDLVDLQPFFEGNAYCLEVAAACAVAGGRTAGAAELLGLATALRDMLGARVWAAVEPLVRRSRDAVRAALDPDAYDRAVADGRRLDPSAAAALCRAALRPPGAEAS
jgi:predicted ATPase